MRVALLALTLILPTAVGAPFLQAGGNAQHSGVFDGDLPEVYEVAFSVRLPGSTSHMEQTLLRDGFAYATTCTSDPGEPQISAVVRINLDTADVEPFADYDFPGQYCDAVLAGTSDHLLIVQPSRVSAHDWATGSLAWSTATSRAGDAIGLDSCLPPTIAPNLIVVACTLQEGSTGVAAGLNGGWMEAFDWGGEQLWCAGYVVEGTCGLPFNARSFGSVGLHEGLLYVAGHDSTNRPLVLAHDAKTGAEVAAQSLIIRTGSDLDFVQETTNGFVPGTRARGLVGSDAFYANWRGTVASFDLGTLEQQYSLNLQIPLADTSEQAITGKPESLLINGGTEVIQVDGPKGAVVTRWSAGPALRFPIGHEIMHDNGVIHGLGSNGILASFESDGTVRETIRLGGQIFDGRLTGGDGLLLVRSDQAQLFVIGRTAASIDLVVEPSSRFPSVERPVTLDVGATRPGIHDGDISYQIEWGDGEVETGLGPTFSHAYGVKGPVTATIRATNDAGQVSVATVTMDVGGTPSNFISEAFAPERQESTFFTLGLILTLLFAGFGAIRLRRKRGTLRKELAKADAIVAATKDDPDQLREQLRSHRANARRLFLDGKMDEGSTGILERHIDELLRDHRLSNVEADLAFLPHGLFRSMQEMLRDARVTQLERNNFLAALSDDKHLSAVEKKRVQRHVETWHREDSA